MDQVPQSSFIPRQSGNMIVRAPKRRRGRLNLLSVISLVCFFGALMLSVGVFLLKQSHEQLLENKKAELATKRSFYKQDDIDAIRALHDRINAAEYLLDSHVSPSILLDLLERTTQEEIQYTSFQFARRPSGNVSVSMQGIAPRFNTVARQAQRYADESLFNRVIFSGLDKPGPQYVSFNVDVDIAKNAIAYDTVAPVVEEEVTSTDPTDPTDTSIQIEPTELVDGALTDLEPTPQDDSI
jgi:hypothetical protein